ncbi:hypothetical protein LUZ61_008294 [Rhynchospora tenuis]|uniref:PUM-HD domain-containing protein n=1 Tax=Rhynchospora tenuis TaxID=198213 RepID=A0AAD6EXE0_9POAL|nr:hypothetical protein LUZ61_008294 [Rhynchospora tenuis]
MATESPVRLVTAAGSPSWSPGGLPTDEVAYHSTGAPLSANQVYGSWRDRESVPKRSGSAPPNIEGSWTALTGLIAPHDPSYEPSLHNLSRSDEESFRANPAYFEYYNSKGNLNPRLPPPLINREGRHLMHKIYSSSSLDDSTGIEVTKGSLFIPRSVLSTHKEEPEEEKSPRLGSGGSSSGTGSEIRHKEIADFTQDEYAGPPSPVHEYPSHPSISSSIVRTPEPDPSQSSVGQSTPLSDLHTNTSSSSNPSSSSPLGSSEKTPTWRGKSISDTRPTPVNVLPATGLEPSGVVITDLQRLEAEMTALSVNFHGQASQLKSQQFPLPQLPFLPRVDPQPVLQPAGITNPFYTPASNLPNLGAAPFYPPPNPNPTPFFNPQYGISGYPLNPNFIPPVLTGFGPQSPVASTGPEFVQPYKYYSHLSGLPVQPPMPDPSYMQFFPQQPALNLYANTSPYNTVATRPPNNVVVSVPTDAFDLHKVHQPAPFSPGMRPISVSPLSVRKGPNPNPNYSGYQMGPQLHYQSASPRRNENLRVQPSDFRNMTKHDDGKQCSFLEELKTNRNRRLELPDIAGRIVEFSADQHGSRFIQQKLENSSPEEKAAVFNEILPHATSLMTDVFGNYVIQKFFEYGSKEQRRELANKLVGHILPLSLQMYGCRVIQKALEVIEPEQKQQLVQELEGHEMQCVRDQNGNHVIQKCIEWVPVEHIGFIITAFRGQVASLSMHPYGCRVIQRVLEHCTGNALGQCIVDEILQSACTLAQDQYGNYVTQHVLEKGKEEERNQIIEKLADQVVSMSQNKYASNVIEKCFQYADPSQRDYLIDRIIQQTDANDALLAMMKDQYANYVVQKILDTCDEKHREVLIGRIRANLSALRKYTYGKHIVTRIEQLMSEGNSAYGS